MSKIEGFTLIGPRYVVADDSDLLDSNGVPKLFVQRWDGPGEPFIAFLKKINAPGYHITAHKTLREFVDKWGAVKRFPVNDVA